MKDVLTCHRARVSALLVFSWLQALLVTGCWGGGGNSLPVDGGVDSEIPLPTDGGTDSGSEDGATPNDGTLRIEALSFAGSEPDYVISGDSASVQVWSDGFSGAGQALYTATDGSVRTRVIYDGSTGDLSRIIDEISGHYVVISEHVGRIEYIEYDENDIFVTGHALVQNGSTFSIGTIVGRAVVDGQVQGQFTGGSGTGSYALIPVESVQLTDVRDVTSEVAQALELGSGAAAVSAFPGIGVTTQTLISIPRMLRNVGVVLVGAATTGALAPAFGAAGVCMILSGHFSNDVANFIENKLMSDEPMVQELVDLAVSHLRDDRTMGIGEFLQNTIDRVKSVFDSGGDGPDSSWTNTSTYEQVSSYRAPTATEVYSYELPTPTSQPPSMAIDVTGQAVFQDNTAYEVTGTIGADGTIDVTGVGIDDTELEIDLDGQLETTLQTVSGTYMRNRRLIMGDPTSETIAENGSFDGSVASIGECESVQASGGQGTFTNVHFVGAGGGTTSFFYDAYSIPDAFTARSGTSYTTGGLVSGSNTAQLTAAPNGFVFVSVSAPMSGTSWEYSLSCVSMGGSDALPLAP